jgi:hypothetical protein
LLSPDFNAIEAFVTETVREVAEKWLADNFAENGEKVDQRSIENSKA